MTINSDQFQQICDGVWRAENYGSSRAAPSYEWGVSCMLEIHGRPSFDGTQYVNVLVQRYKNELRESN